MKVQLNFLSLLIALSIFFSTAIAAEEEVKAGFGKSCLMTRTLNVDELKDYSGMVFRGKYLGSKYKKERGLNVRELNFKVIDPIKGVSKKDSSLTLKEWANIRSPFVDESVEQGKEYVFFFHQPSPRDLTSLTGLEQGIAKIDENGKVKFSKRLSMKRKAVNIKKKIFTSSDASSTANQDVQIQTYEDLKNFFQ